MQEQSHRTGFEIAIVGMSGRFPGADNLHEFWENLKNGVHSIRFFTEEELLQKSGMDPEMIKQPNFVKAKGIIENAEYFDAFFFGYSPLEAEVLDPQVRIFSEICWEALEDAGCDPSTYNGPIGVYAGATPGRSWEVLTALSRKGDALGQFTADILSDKDFLSSRISHKLDLRGPSVTLFTACSTGLAAVDLACRGLLTGQCDAALAGGVSAPSEYANAGGYLFSEGMISSPDGYVRAFDAKAGGTVFSSGAGAVLLKRLDSAIADGDSIYAVIKGFAVNNDGVDKSSFTAPAVEGQSLAAQAALHMAEIEPESITYIEAHGTATEIGDPIEIEALKTAFQTDKKQYCAIGSVKTNIGHLDVAAGIAGLVKVMLMLKHRLIPPSLHYEKPNPKIDFENSPFFVNTQLREWKSNGHPLRAGVSSFGVGGGNVHLVLEEWPGIEESREGPGGTTFKSKGREEREEFDEKDLQLILLSARTGEALDKMTDNLANYLSENPGYDLADIAYTLKVGRKAFEHRKMLVCKDAPEAVSILHSSLAPEDGGGRCAQTYYTKEGKRAVFMFPGQGSQYVDMARGLYEKEPLFRREIDRCFEIPRPITGYDFKKILYPSLEENSSNGSYRTNIIDQTEVTQPVLFIIEYALARLLMAWGIKPYAMIGHGIGEYTAACLSGVFSLEDALTVVAWHGKLMRQMPKGDMLSVSSMMDPILKTFEMKVAQVQRNQPRIPFISNITGQWISNRDAGDPAYWTRHLRGTVRFNDGLTELLKEKNTLLIEVGPGRTLSTFIEQHPGEPSEHTAVNLLRPPDEKIDDRYYLTAKIGQIWLYGLPIDWRAYYGEEKRYRLHLPTYPFQRQRYWIEGNPAAIIREGVQRISAHGKRSDVSDWFYIPSWKPSLVLLNDNEMEEKEGKVLLLLNGENDFCIRLKEKFLRQGYDTIVVRTGAEFSDSGGGEFSVNPSKPGDYQALFQALRQSKQPLRRIVHTWTISNISANQAMIGMQEAPSDDEREIQYRGFYSLLYIVQAIKKQNFQAFTRDFKIIVVSSQLQAVDGEEMICPWKSTVLSPLKVIPQELSEIRCRNIDIVVPEPSQGSSEEEKLIILLLKDIVSDSADTIVAYRYNRRWIQIFEAVKPGGNWQLESLLREKGVYLITGGLGGIGLVLAEYLSGSVGARMILTGRSEFPGRNDWKKWLNAHDKQDPTSQKIRKLQEIEKKGGEVMVCRVDIADVGRMKEVIGRAEARFGQLNGVIHAAGILGRKSNLCAVEDMTEIEVEEQSRPKIAGLIALAEVLKDKKIDFCLLTSSISSILGGLGYAAYAAANIFMDAFVKEYNRTHGGSWVSVNWDAWELREQEPANTAREGNRAELIITPPEGREVFRRIIAFGSMGRENQVVISTGELQSRIDRWIDFKYLQADESSVKTNIVQHSRPEIATPYSPPQSPIEQKLAQIWQKLLGIDRVGGNDDFFELGGDSLKATQLAAKIKQTFNTNISVREIFNTPQLGELAKQMTIPMETDNLYSHLAPVEKKEYYPVSSMQKRLYFLNEIEGIGTAYNISFMLIIDGELNKPRMEQVYGLLISRHESFRTTFHMIDGEPAQVIHETDELDFHLEYLSCENREDVVDDLVRNFCKPFDLTKAPLVRAMLIKLAERKHMLFFDAHHIIADYTSWLNIGRDFDALYGNRNLPGLRIQYKDFSQWRNTPEVIKAIIQQEAFWLEMLSGELPILELPTDYPRPMPQSFEGKRITFELPGDETSGLKQIAQAQGATLFMVLLALYNVLLSKLSNLEDIMIGTAIAGRIHADLERIVGMFVNTLVMRNYPVGNKTFGEFLTDVKENTLAVFENQEYPFEGLVEKLAVARDLGRNPIFDVMLVLQNFSEITLVNQEKEVTGEGLVIRAREYEQRSAKFDLTLEVYEQEGILLLYFKYCTKLFRQESILRFTRYFQTIVTSVISAPARKIMEIDILPEEEKRQLLFDFNNTAAAFPDDKTIPEIFAAQVEKTPDHIAVFGRGRTRTNTDINVGADLRVCPITLSYNELNEQSGRLAQVLIEKGVLANTIVGLMMERSLEMITGILGILKAGGAYLPIDPDYPLERIDYMIKESAAQLLVINNDKEGEKLGVRRWEGEKVLLEFIIHSSNHISFHHSSFIIHHSNHLAYIIYTSGSTGRPKGVMVEHRNVINLVYGLRERIYSKYDRQKNLAVALVAPYIFDASVKQIFGVLLQGYSLYIVPEDVRLDGEKLFEYYKRYTIDISDGTPSHLRLLLESRGGKNLQLNINRFLIGGEPLTVKIVEKLFDQFETCSLKITNVYGPTECCVDTTTYEFSKKNIGVYANLPIGGPMPNQQVYIVGKVCNLQPLGVPGELCIGGNSVSRGYLNNPELTLEKFDRSYRSYKTYILYKTGDLARWLVDPAAQGAYIIEFLGRIDQQVKIRGFRIELGEIEAQLLRHNSLKEAVVLDMEGESGEKYLCAYIVSKEPLDSAGLREYLLRRLPDYMVPASFISVERIPFTSRGKVDKKVLQSYKTTLGAGVEYMAPGSDLEQQIADSWKEVLKLEKVSIYDNFFERGGNSLNIIQLTNRLNKLLGKNLPVVTLFQYPTISALARHLEENKIKNQAAPAIKTARDSEELSFTLKESTDIAVIGMAGRFPGAANIDEFWNNLKEGVESISFFTDEELREVGVSPELLNDPNYVKARGIMEGKEKFDAGFFDYIPADARLMDPQMRIFHECTWEALENAGYIPDNYNGSIGVYAGASHSIEWEARVLLSQLGRAAGEYELSHLINKDFLATRVSYKLNLRGPAVSIQTACSTSLVAVHMACRALIDRDCDMVAAGGVTLQAAGKVGYRYQEGMIFSPDGHCRPFDARSGGIVSGDGIGVVILKRLKEAEADGDNIYAVVKGSAINNDGFNKVGYPAPSVEGQREVIAKALLLAGVEPETVSYVETHGTGTALGDPIEIKALTLAFATEKRNYCAIGSVKSNVGHLDSAAGVAGFIKTVMALYYRQIPPSLHFKTPNPAIDFENSPFYVITQLRPWKSHGYPLRAGANAFGIGGTNAHVVLEEWPAVKRNREGGEERKDYQLILLSAKTSPALAEMRERLAGFLKEKPGLNLADTAYTLQAGRKAFKHRAILTASSGEEASDLLRSADKIQYHLLTEEKQNIVFMFPGQGSQYVGMARKLYENEPIFRLEMDRCFERLHSLTGYDFKKILYPSLEDNGSNDFHGNSMINQTEISQPVIFIIEYALAQLLMAWGIKPHSMIGHSIGEYTAACLSGVFSLADALEIVCLRGKLMQQLPGGTMLGIPLPEEKLIPLLEGMDDISLAAVNSSSLCVVSGTDEAVAEFEKQLQMKGYQSRRLQTSHAFHSSMMDPILEKFAQTVGRLTMHKPRIPYLSNVTGKWIMVEDAVDPRYWARHLRQTVRFLDGITILLNDSTSPSVFMEIGPGKALGAFVRQHKDRKNRAAQVVNLVRHPREDTSDDKYLLDKVGQLWLYGITPDWQAFHSGEKRKRIPLPTYPFQRVEFRLGGNFMDIASGFRGLEMGFERGEMTAENEADLTGISLPGSAQRPEISTVYVPPRNKTEQTLARIWENFFGIEKIGCNDDFFELGGDSLKAVTLVARIQKELNVRISLPDFFRTAKIGELAAYIGKASYEHFQSIKSVEEKEYYGVSSAQKRLFILQRMEPGNTNYNLPQVVILEGELNPGSLGPIFKKLIRRHESLRTSFVMINEEPVQQIHKNVEFEIEYYDIATGDTEEIIHHFIRAFDLAKAPLMRVGIIKEAETRYILAVDIHHIAADGVSLELLIKEFKALYIGKELPPPRVQYKDYAWWQSCGEQKEAIRQQEAYWLEQLYGEIPVLELPMDFPRPAVQSFEGYSLGFEIAAPVVKGLKKLAAREGVTLYMVLLSAITIFLAKLSNQEDIIVGTPTAGRRHADLERIIGMFVNTLPIRNFPVGEKRFKDFLGEVKARTLAAFENQDYQFEDMVEQVLVTRDVSRNPLFDVLFVLQNLEVQPGINPDINIPGLMVKPYDSLLLTAKFDITLSCYEGHDELVFRMEYSTSLFKEDTIKRFIDYYGNIISAVLANPGGKIADIEIITEAEKRQILEEFNDTETAFPADKTIHELFENQVERAPDNIALVGADLRVCPVTLSYRELNEQSRRLAELLIEKGVLAGDIIGIMFERSIEMIIGILGILKSGGAYLPMDPDYPRERINYMLMDSGTKLLVANNDKEGEKVGRWEGEKVHLEFIIHSSNHISFHHSSFIIHHSNQLSYIIYTSGTTGRPKGVLVKHRGVVNLVYFYQKIFGGVRDSHVSQVASPTFDAMAFEVWPCLSTGAVLYIADNETRMNAGKMVRWLIDRAITHSFQPTIMAEYIMNEQWPGEGVALKVLLAAGSRLNHYPLHRRHFILYNLYGPTEDTVWSTWAEVAVGPRLEGFPSIGKPAANHRVYIIGPHFQLQPIGIAGELCIGGVGLAVGYLNRPELTWEKFFENPHVLGERVYRTGDLARWLPDGNIDFIGRLDFQVKIRGYRIEPGEIENELLSRPDIKEVKVLDRTDNSGDKYLCAYIVPGRPITDSVLKEYLSGRLPGYMVPRYFVLMERIPLTLNGKVDRKALPEPGIAPGDNYAAPGNEIEEKMAVIWSEVLGIEKNKISVDADFFELGGHSLKAIMMISRICKAFDVNISLMDIFRLPTIRALAQNVKKATEMPGEKYAAVEPVEKKEYYSLSSAQKRLYILNRMNPASTGYNITQVKYLDGLDRGKLEEAFRRLIQRHESLRTSFILANEEPVQRIHDEVEFKIERLGGDATLSQWPSDIIINFIRPFDLSKAPLLRVGILRDIEGRCLLIIDLHHIISDGVSGQVLAAEFMKLYNGEELLPLRIQYKDFAHWQHDTAMKASVKQQEVYWVKEFAGEIAVVDLPYDYPRPAVQSFEGGRSRFELSIEETHRLKQIASSHGATLFMILLAIYDIFLAKLSNREDIVVGIPIAGRGHADLEAVVGMFINTLAMRNYPGGERTFADFLGNVRERALAAFENQDFQFEDLVEKVVVARDMGRNPLFDVMFVLQNFDESLPVKPAIEIQSESPGIMEWGYDLKSAKFDLTLEAYEQEGRLLFHFKYCTRLFRKESISRFIRYFKTIAASILEAPAKQIAEIDILPEEEKRQLLFDFNGTAAAYPGDKTIPEIFEAQVEKTADHIAIVGAALCARPGRPVGPVGLSYRELNEQSARLALLLNNKGVLADDVVGLIVGPSVEMPIGILGILKSGGAYLPIDPEFPRERIDYMLKDSAAKLLVTTNDKEGEKVGRWEGEKVLFEEIFKSPKSPSYPLNFLSSYLLNPSNLVYIIYTSGTTGKPKGALIENKNLVNYVHWFRETTGLTGKDRTILTSSFCFDLGYTVVYPSILSGCQFHIVPKDLYMSPVDLLAYIIRHLITYLKMTPSFFNAIAASEEFRRENSRELRLIVLGGEKIKPDDVKKVHEAGPRIKIMNHYGPTETTIGCIAQPIDFEKFEEFEKRPTIGNPIANLKIFILDKTQALTPVGVPGELCVSGAGVGRGYLNRPELTAEKFNRSYKSYGTNIFYRTGDLARWLLDGPPAGGATKGIIEFLGRIDQQVKIKGFRIELGEIESELSKHGMVKEAVVIDRENETGEKYLCGYIVSEEEFELTMLKDFLSKRLPNYMVPSYFMRVENIPLNSNGKLDRGALPEPGIILGDDYVPPGNEIEETLLAIWSEVLGIEKSKISINANFFDLGGHSLKIMILIAKIHQVFNFTLELAQVFKAPTIRGVAAIIEVVRWVHNHEPASEINNEQESEETVL